MKKTQNYHRAFGVYGICIENEQLLVINKNAGPYINRYDLPGGSLETGESLSIAVQREFLEETGVTIEIKQNIRVIDFQLSCNWRDFTDIHHIAVYYLVSKIVGELKKPLQFEGQDSIGALWVSEQEVSIENASPLVLKAFEWMRTKSLGIRAECYEDWKINY
ncbi:ADP-ribose pyrophosphatase YjhB (NUDIX family) [Sporosarcina luteola]|nr:ADP-ribose pyrophosphatase YjhB (NUDIX family) [Sporosarcina luteola]